MSASSPSSPRPSTQLHHQSTEHHHPSTQHNHGSVISTGAAKPRSGETRFSTERRRQLRGFILLAFAVMAFALWRAGLDRVFTPGWWRLW